MRGESAVFAAAPTLSAAEHLLVLECRERAVSRDLHALTRERALLLEAITALRLRLTGRERVEYERLRQLAPSPESAGEPGPAGCRGVAGVPGNGRPGMLRAVEALARVRRLNVAHLRLCAAEARAGLRGDPALARRIGARIDLVDARMGALEAHLASAPDEGAPDEVGEGGGR